MDASGLSIPDKDIISNNSLEENLYNSIQQEQPSGLNTSEASLKDQYNDNIVKNDLVYFFADPFEKVLADKTRLFSPVIQFIKIVLVTVQLCLFGVTEFALVTFEQENLMTFENLFLRNWDSTADAGIYPDTKSLYALYTKEDFYDHIENAINQYSKLDTISLGTYVSPTNYIHVHLKEFEQFRINEGFYEISLTPKQCHVNLNVSEVNGGSRFKDYMNDHGCGIDFKKIRTLTLEFNIQTVRLTEKTILLTTECIIFHVKIEYDNSHHSGRVSVRLSEKHDVHQHCTEQTGLYLHGQDPTFEKRRGWRLGNGVLVLLICLLSMFLSCRSFLGGHQLLQKTAPLFQHHYQREFIRSERMRFINLWYVIIIFSDLLTVSGTVMKLLLEQEVHYLDDICSLLLGIGCFLTWFSNIGYLELFPSYSLPIVTVKCAMPNVLRFLLCAAVIYLGYGFCGWVVLGPYHKKFETFTTTMASMFSLINGDDMYPTFAAMSQDNPLIYTFSQFYLYTFISLFIYIVLSLVIAVVVDTYETVKEARDKGGREDDLQAFINLCKKTLELSEIGCRQQSSNKRCETPDEKSPLLMC